jgi:chemotaxis protein methyltransferase CheR
VVEITDEELNSLNRVILTRYGIDFTSYETTSFKRRVSRAMSVFKMESVLELWSKFLKDREFIYPFIDQLTVGLTAMFRDPILWNTLKKSTLNNHFAQKEELHIWHAGCSTGEEVFTMGIVLSDTGFKDKANALATDLNQSFIRTAREGNYHISVKDEYTRNYAEYNSLRKLDTYFTVDGDMICLDKKLCSHVQYRHHNLLMDKMAQKFDIIFCRNVMIYFDNTAKLKLLDQFHQCLNDGGFFIIGFYDALLPLIDHKKFEIFDINAKIFRKIS